MDVPLKLPKAHKKKMHLGNQKENLRLSHIKVFKKSVNNLCTLLCNQLI